MRWTLSKWLRHAIAGETIFYACEDHIRNCFLSSITKENKEFLVFSTAAQNRKT